MTVTFLWKTVSAIYFLLFGKVWLSFICRSPSVKPANKSTAEFTQRR